MKTILTFLFSYLFFISFHTKSQNLVPNPGFEMVNKLPDRKGNGISRAKNWLAPFANADYYHRAADRHAGVPKNIFGRQKPHSGDAYAGMCIRTNFMEYIQTKLIDTLIKDREYLVEFYISRAERSIGSVKEFGLMFTNKIILGSTNMGINYKPSLDFTNTRGYRNKRKWTKLSAVYKATGKETVIILGYFNYDLSKSFKGISHYYLDDVSVTLIEKKVDAVVNKTVIIEQAADSIPVAFSASIGETIRLTNIFFETNKSELLPQSFSELDNLVQFLNKDLNTNIEISGHTDNTGDEKQNRMLSEARAKAVSDYLISKKIDPTRIKYKGYGSAKPITTNDTDEGKQLNRRVEFRINKNESKR
jgi:OOP family OmpA-OmpF porin